MLRVRVRLSLSVGPPPHFRITVVMRRRRMDSLMVLHAHYTHPLPTPFIAAAPVCETIEENEADN